MAKNKTKYYLSTSYIDKKIVANIDNGIIILDNKLCIYHYNKWLELHTKIKEIDVIGKKLNEIFESIKTKTLIRKIKTALTLNSPTFYSATTSNYLIPIKTNRIKNDNFEYMQQDISIIPFDKELNLVALIITDQTNMSNTNALLYSHIEKIKELNNKFTKEHETINKKILFIKFDKFGLIYDVSQALLDLLMYSNDEFINKNFFLYEKNNFSEDIKKEIIYHMKKQETYTFEQKIFDSTSKELYLKSSLVPEYDSKGLHIGFILFRENITSSKALEKNNETMLTNSRSAAMGEMISMIAHQWRQPLSLINTVIATIKIKKDMNQLDDKTMNIYFEKIETSVNYLSETIDDFREYFKPNKKASEINILTLFDKSIFFLKEEMSQSGIEYEIKIDNTITIQTYKNEFLQSVINIVKNSIDAFKEIQKNKKISVKVEKEEEHIKIFIEDNAGGIPEDIINKIYEPYFSTKSKNGTGLGLYMCRTIINEHLHGDLQITSEDNRTKATIKLPYSIV